MLTIYIDADACPVKEEVYRVARRYTMRVAIVAKAPQRVPPDPLMELVVRADFGAVDDWIAEQSGPGDIVITADIPLAARCLEKAALVLDPKGNPFHGQRHRRRPGDAQSDGRTPSGRHRQRRPSADDAPRSLAIPVRSSMKWSIRSVAPIRLDLNITALRLVAAFARTRGGDSGIMANSAILVAAFARTRDGTPAFWRTRLRPVASAGTPAFWRTRLRPVALALPRSGERGYAP